MLSKKTAKNQAGSGIPELKDAPVTDWGLFLIRIVVCLFFCGATISIFLSGNKDVDWIPSNGYIDARIISGAGLITGILILLGLFTCQSVIAAGILILVIVSEHLIKNPFYNFSAQLFPLLLFTIIILYLGPGHNKISADSLLKFDWKIDKVKINSLAILFLRIFLGAIFLTQGLNNIIKVGVINFAQKIYVAPFAGSGLPQFLLWAAGLLNPPVQFIGGLALILGFKTRLTSVGIGLFLTSIIFGHMIQAPFEDIHDFGIANFITVLAIMFLEAPGNRYSLDFILT